jgi:DNA end-binding protein Ku
VKGYEYASGKYVVINDEDLEKLPLKTVRSIEIEQFVDRAEAERQTRFVKQAYYIEPDKIGRKAFALLRTVLAEEGLTAVCKVVIKDREALAALDPFENTMLLSTLYWPDEIRALGELELPDEEIELKPAERLMAQQLIATMTGEFDPAQYRDEYRDALMQIIEGKIEGREVAAPAPADEGGAIIDLMAALEASVRAAQAAREEPAPVKARKSA